MWRCDKVMQIENDYDKEVYTKWQAFVKAYQEAPKVGAVGIATILQ